MTQLSVNINKIATLRNARGGNVPNVLQCTLDLIHFGAEGITVHPRPDERHIRKNDVYEIAKAISVEFNIEGYPDSSYLKLISDIQPAQATLVPDPPDVLTSNAGWKVEEHLLFLRNAVKQIKKQSPETRISVFIYPADVQKITFSLLYDIGVSRIELYTGPYAEHYHQEQLRNQYLAEYAEVAKQAQKIGLGVNAGHDLNLVNLPLFIKQIPQVLEVSIGQAFIADALYYGFENTLLRYKLALSY